MGNGYFSDIHVVEEKTISELLALLEEGAATSKELVLAYLERIAKIDKSGPTLNSIAEINPDAAALAEVRDAQRKKGEIIGPLHGIPVVIKDNIDSGDKMHTTAGSIALKDHYAGEDAFVVKKLKAAGAIILGKANLTEWANFIAIGMRNGFSSRGGAVLNCYGPGRFDVGGSSSGPAVAAGANLAACGIGTETSGSIIMPAALASCVGIKPSIGLISRTGIIPLSFTQDTAGPICRTVEDAALMLGVLVGEDEKDPITWFAKDWEGHDYTQYLDRDALKGAKLGFLREGYFERLDEEGARIVESALGVLKNAGAKIVDPVKNYKAAEMARVLISMKGGLDVNVLYHEFKVALNAYLARVEPHLPVHSLRELVEFNLANKETALKYGQAHLEKADLTDGSLASLEYFNSRMQDERVCGEESIDRALDEYGLDALVYPNYYAQTVAARVGYASITVPAGYSSGIGPVSITFVGRKFDEPRLIRLAYAYEQASKVRKPPVFDVE